MALAEEIAPHGKENHDDHSSGAADQHGGNPKFYLPVDERNRGQPGGIEKQRNKSERLKFPARAQPTAGELSCQRQQRGHDQEMMKGGSIETPLRENGF